MVARRSLAKPTVREATDRWLETLNLDEAGNARAATVRALASKLDACAAKDPVGGDPMAGLAKEWRELVDAILDSTGDTETFVADLFSEVG